MKIVIGLILGLLIGAGCRWFDIPSPAPPKLLGAALVMAMTVGYLAMDRWLSSSSDLPKQAVELSSKTNGE